MIFRQYDYEVDNFKNEYDLLTNKNASLIAKSAQEIFNHLKNLKDLSVQEEMGISSKNALAQDANLNSLIQDVKNAMQPTK